MCSTPSRPPETAFFTIVSMSLPRYVTARTSIGRSRPPIATIVTPDADPTARQGMLDVLRQFFEKSAHDDDRELFPLLKFYFFARQLAPDDLDKVDFLLTRVGTRRQTDGGLELKPAEELAELCGTFLTLTGREEADPVEVRSVLNILEVLRKDIEACGRFEDLIRKKPLENIRTLKRRMGNVFYSAEVLQALLASNVAAKRKFQSLYQKEEERILATSRHLLELEAELGLDPRFQSDEFQADFRRFRREREDFEKQANEGDPTAVRGIGGTRVGRRINGQTHGHPRRPGQFDVNVEVVLPLTVPGEGDLGAVGREARIHLPARVRGNRRRDDRRGTRRFWSQPEPDRGTHGADHGE